MKILLIVLISFLCGCASILNDNSVMVDIAVRQAVFHYIDAAESEAGKDKRAAQVVQAVRNVDKYLEGNPTASPDVILVVIESQVRWDKLSLTDAAILRDVMMLVRHNLQNRQSEGLLDVDAVIAIRSILNAAATAASLL